LANGKGKDKKLYKKGTRNRIQRDIWVGKRKKRGDRVGRSHVFPNMLKQMGLEVGRSKPVKNPSRGECRVEGGTINGTYRGVVQGGNRAELARKKAFEEGKCYAGIGIFGKSGGQGRKKKGRGSSQCGGQGRREKERRVRGRPNKKRKRKDRLDGHKNRWDS